MDKLIDQSTWPRKEIFDFFSTVSNPFYMVTFRQDVTPLYDYVKAHGLSFYYALVYLCSQAINHVPAFRYAVREGQVLQLAERWPSFTDLRKGSELFHIVTLPCEGGMADFCRKAKEKSQSQQSFIDLSNETDALIYFSCLPWVDLTALTNERDLAAPGARDEAIPHIPWGKYVQEGERKVLGLSIEVNHRFIDGVHIGQFAAELTRSMEALRDSSL